MPVIDVPTAFDPSKIPTGVVLTNSNRSVGHLLATRNARSVVGVTSGKWFVELKTPTPEFMFGIVDASFPNNQYVGSSNSIALWANNGEAWVNGAGSPYNSLLAGPGTYFIKLDMDARKVTFGNGELSGPALNLPAGIVTAHIGCSTGSSSVSEGPFDANFGQSQFFAKIPLGYYRGMGSLKPALVARGIVVGDQGNPAERIVRAYNRQTGAIIAQSMSSSVSGAFELNCEDCEHVYVVALDDEAGVVHNALILDRIDTVSE